MKIIYNKLSGLFKASKSWEKALKLTKDDELTQRNENNEQEDAYQDSAPTSVHTTRYNMRDHVTISITNARFV
mgnify:CR=1 FL=1